MKDRKIEENKLKKPITLVIMDGYGLSDQREESAILAANTPYLDQLFENAPTTQLQAAGEEVGLPQGQMGNSEVGHVNIGAGRVIYQDLPRITAAVKDESIFTNQALQGAMNHVADGVGSLHFMGLLSDGGVHSHIKHLYALLAMAKRQGIEKVYIHGFLDGRDVAPNSAANFVKDCMETCKELGVGKIATLMGRYYALDRDARWDRVEEAYQAMVMGAGIQNSDPFGAVEESYQADILDEFVRPVVCDPEGMIKAGDSVICFNFRPDRAREITRSLVDPDFDGFVRENGHFPLHFVCMTQYDETMPNVTVAYPPQSIENTLGQWLSKHEKTQLRIAETEKYAHVTFFFNGGVEAAYEGEQRILIPSPKTQPTYDLIPEMSAQEVAEETVKQMEQGEFDVIIVNFANPDMVGHTGQFDATVKAVEMVDSCVEKVVEKTVEMGGIALITADHGNAEHVRNKDGSPQTAHTTNPVPFTIVGAQGISLTPGKLADIAPTILHLMGLPIPKEMDGVNLVG